jgi:hypothetical protein
VIADIAVLLALPDSIVDIEPPIGIGMDPHSLRFVQHVV